MKKKVIAIVCAVAVLAAAGGGVNMAFPWKRYKRGR